MIEAGYEKYPQAGAAYRLKRGGSIAQSDDHFTEVYVTLLHVTRLGLCAPDDVLKTERKVG